MSAKAQAMMALIKEQLKFRLPSTYILTDSFDASSNPVLTVAQDSAWATTEQYAVIRIQPASLVFTNAIGGTQEGFTPHYVDVCTESITTGSVLSTSIGAPLFQTIEQEAGITRYYLSNLAVTPSVTMMTSGNLVQTDTPSVIWRANGAQ